MGKTLFVSVDLGTSFIKVGLYDEHGVCHAVETEAVDIKNLGPEIYIQYADELFASVLKCLKKTIELAGSEKAGKVCAIAFTGQMAGFMGVDKDWNDITTWSCSLDTRFAPFVDKQMELYAERFLEIGGTNSPLMAPKCEWFKHDFPEESSKIAKYMMISSYVIGRLGECPIEEAVIDSSFIAWTGLADVRKGEWSKELCSYAGISVEKLPRIVKSHEICGELSPKMAEIVGLKGGIPLVSGAGDKVAGCVGANVLTTGDMIFEASSYGAISCLVDEYLPNYKTCNYDAVPAANTKQFYAHKYIQGSGVTFKWYKDNFYGKDVSYVDIDKEIANIPCGSDGVMSIPLLGGSAIPFDGKLRGMFMGHTWSHHKGHFFHSLLESVGYELALTIDSIKEMYQGDKYNNQVVKVIGGGAKSSLWIQILSDICGMEFQRLNRDDVALWGTAILAGNAVGVFPTLEGVAKDTITVEKIFKTNPENNKKYLEYKKIYDSLLKPISGYCARIQDVQ